jgi:hypothetical protein
MACVKRDRRRGRRTGVFTKRRTFENIKYSVLSYGHCLKGKCLYCRYFSIEETIQVLRWIFKFWSSWLWPRVVLGADTGVSEEHDARVLFPLPFPWLWRLPSIQSIQLILQATNIKPEMEREFSSETSVSVYKTTGYHFPERRFLKTM